VAEFEGENELRRYMKKRDPVLHEIASDLNRSGYDVNTSAVQTYYYRHNEEFPEREQSDAEDEAEEVRLFEESTSRNRENRRRSPSGNYARNRVPDYVPELQRLINTTYWPEFEGENRHRRYMKKRDPVFDSIASDLNRSGYDVTTSAVQEYHYRHNEEFPEREQSDAEDEADDARTANTNSSHHQLSQMVPVVSIVDLPEESQSTEDLICDRDELMYETEDLNEKAAAPEDKNEETGTAKKLVKLRSVSE